MKPDALVFFDLDGTLLNEYSQINPSVMEAIQELRKKNVLPFIATGRSASEIEDVAGGTGIDSFVSMNGMYVQYEGKKLSDHPMNKRLINKMMKMADDLDVALSLYTAHEIGATRHTEALIKAYEFIHADIPPVDEMFHEREEVLMAVIMNDDPDKDGLLIREFPEFSFYRTSPYSVDIIEKGYSKATGIDEILTKLDWKDIPKYAFGDGLNDIEMFKRVDHAIAMENGVSKIKKAADYVTSSNIDDGVIQGLEKYGLL